jgi:hypothetical protein
MAVLEDGPDLHGEGLTAPVALIEPDAGGFALELPNSAIGFAVWTNRPVRPKPSFYIGVSRLFAVEMWARKY